jgi:cell division protein ZapD
MTVRTHYSPQTEQITTFEHPMSENMRLCLRIEALYNRIFHAIQEQQTQTALIDFLKLVDVLDRPDLKGKLSQTLNNYASSLGQLEQFEQVDTTRLHQILGRIDALNTMLHQESDKPTDKLKKMVFLNHLRMQLTSPGGISCHSNYVLKTWENQPLQQRINDLNEWLETLNVINNCTQLILHLTRDSGQSQHCIAHQGQYHKDLHSNLPVGLIQINVSTEHLAYPDISASKHHISVRFVVPDFHHTEQAQPSKEDIPFTLTYCQL